LVAELPRTGQAPGIARRRLVEWFAAELDRLELQNAKLLVSELVTNAVIHGRGRIELHALLEQDRLRVEVINEGPGFMPAVRERDHDTRDRWGLRVVEEQASRWGIREGAAGVWFELARQLPGPDGKPSGPSADAQRPR
jgi:anti-sigma regulatory factor (Ser/Thr protein kinase)